jgi:hypothetical protein
MASYHGWIQGSPGGGVRSPSGIVGTKERGRLPARDKEGRAWVYVRRNWSLEFRPFDCGDMSDSVRAVVQ